MGKNGPGTNQHSAKPAAAKKPQGSQLKRQKIKKMSVVSTPQGEVLAVPHRLDPLEALDELCEEHFSSEALNTVIALGVEFDNGDILMTEDSASAAEQLVDEAEQAAKELGLDESKVFDKFEQRLGVEVAPDYYGEISNSEQRKLGLLADLLRDGSSVLAGARSKKEADELRRQLNSLLDVI